MVEITFSQDYFSIIFFFFFFLRFQGHLYTFKWNPILFYSSIDEFVYSLYKSIKVLGSENV